jgi:protein involved in polysaccharide export with SLBB domain
LLIVTLALLCPKIFWAQESGDNVKENVQTNIDNSYVLAGKDVLTVTVFDEENLSTTQPIDGNNEIKVPLIGKIKVGGLTVREAETLIEKEFIDKEYLRDPLVTIKVQSRKEVFVLGEVNSPGTITFKSDVNTLNIVELIAMCSGFTKLANKKTVEVSRRMSDGTFQTKRVNLEAVLQEKERDKQGDQKIAIFEVKPGDIVFVAQRFL